VADRPGLTLIFWIFFSTGFIMACAWLSWRMHDKRNAKRHAQMQAKKDEAAAAGATDDWRDWRDIEDWEI
jgi:Flp pilus assembly protein TadB